MKIHADTVYAIGKTHTVCQDYARVWHDEKTGSVVAALSDGCSGSPDTDIGARLMVRVAAGLPDLAPCSLTYKAKQLAYDAQILAKQLGFPPNCTDATLLSIVVDPNKLNIHTYIAGDGVLVYVNLDTPDTPQIADFNFSGEAPGYLSYLVSETRLAAYLASNPVRTKGVSMLVESSTSFFAVTPVNQQNLFLEFSYPIASAQRIFAFSDGIKTFEREIEPGKFEPVPLDEVLTQLLAIPNFNGAFMQRRCNRFFKAFCVKNKWHHNDDFSVAAVIIEHEDGDPT